MLQYNTQNNSTFPAWGTTTTQNNEMYQYKQYNNQLNDTYQSNNFVSSTTQWSEAELKEFDLAFSTNIPIREEKPLTNEEVEYNIQRCLDRLRVRNKLEYYTERRNAYVDPRNEAFSMNYSNTNSFSTYTSTSSLYLNHTLPKLEENILSAMQNSALVEAMKTIPVPPKDNPYAAKIYHVEHGTTYWDTNKQKILTPLPGSHLIVDKQVMDYSGLVMEEVNRRANRKVRAAVRRNHLDEIITEDVPQPKVYETIMGDLKIELVSHIVTDTRREIRKMRQESAAFMNAANTLDISKAIKDQQWGMTFEVTEKMLNDNRGILYNSIAGNFAKLGDKIKFQDYIVSIRHNRKMLSDEKRKLRKTFLHDVKALAAQTVREDIIDIADECQRIAEGGTLQYCEILKREVEAYYARNALVAGGRYVVIDDGVTPPPNVVDYHGIVTPAHEFVETHVAQNGEVYHHNLISDSYVNNGQIVTVNHEEFKNTASQEEQDAVYKKINNQLVVAPQDRNIAPVRVQLHDGKNIRFAKPEADRVIIARSACTKSELNTYAAHSPNGITEDHKILAGAEISKKDLDSIAHSLGQQGPSENPSKYCALYNISNPYHAEKAELLQLYDAKYSDDLFFFTWDQEKRFYELKTKYFGNDSDAFSEFIQGGRSALFRPGQGIGPITDPIIPKWKLPALPNVPEHKPKGLEGTELGHHYMSDMIYTCEYHMLDVNIGVTDRIRPMLCPQGIQMLEDFQVRLREHNVREFPIVIGHDRIPYGIVDTKHRVWLADIDIEHWKVTKPIVFIEQRDRVFTHRHPDPVITRNGVQYPPLVSHHDNARTIPTPVEEIISEPVPAPVPSRNVPISHTHYVNFDGEDLVIHDTNIESVVDRRNRQQYQACTFNSEFGVYVSNSFSPVTEEQLLILEQVETDNSEDEKEWYDNSEKEKDDEDTEDEEDELAMTCEKVAKLRHLICEANIKYDVYEEFNNEESTLDDEEGYDTRSCVEEIDVANDATESRETGYEIEKEKRKKVITDIVNKATACEYLAMQPDFFSDSWQMPDIPMGTETLIEPAQETQERSHQHNARLHARLCGEKYIESNEMGFEIVNDVPEGEEPQTIPAQIAYQNKYFLDANITKTYGRHLLGPAFANTRNVNHQRNTSINGLEEYYDNDICHILFLKRNKAAQEWFYKKYMPTWWDAFLEMEPYSAVVMFMGRFRGKFMVDSSLLPKAGIRHLLVKDNDIEGINDRKYKKVIQDVVQVNSVETRGYVATHLDEIGEDLAEEIHLWLKHPRMACYSYPHNDYTQEQKNIRDHIWGICFLGKDVDRMENTVNTIHREIFNMEHDPNNICTAMSNLYIAARSIHEKGSRKAGRKDPGSPLFETRLHRYLTLLDMLQGGNIPRKFEDCILELREYQKLFRFFTKKVAYVQGVSVDQLECIRHDLQYTEEHFQETVAYYGEIYDDLAKEAEENACSLLEGNDDEEDDDDEYDD